MPIPSLMAILFCLLGVAGLGLPGPVLAVDANVASQAELQSIRGIGPAIAARIIAERERGPYIDLEDLRDRVRGIGAASLRRMTEAGLEVTSPAGMAGGPGSSGERGPGANTGRARAWVRDVPGAGAQPRRPSSPGKTGW
ncbi:MAG: helix-hairpin-helix domain-containing protein [Burkholderiaceae bacterium]